jgi:hypothetical protein
VYRSPSPCSSAIFAMINVACDLVTQRQRNGPYAPTCDGIMTATMKPPSDHAVGWTSPTRFEADADGAKQQEGVSQSCHADV